jgi:threonine aldolase
LCGEKAVIDKMQHLIKVHGGSVYSNWANAAMALDHIDGFETRLQNAIGRSTELIALLNQLPEIKITPIPAGTNMHNFKFAPGNDIAKIRTLLREKYNIVLGGPREDGFIKFTVNETLLLQDTRKIAGAFKSAIKEARI